MCCWRIRFWIDVLLLGRWLWKGMVGVWIGYWALDWFMFFLSCFCFGSSRRMDCLCLWNGENLLGFVVIVELRWLWERELIFGRFWKESTLLLIVFFVAILFVGIVVLLFGTDSFTTLAYDLLFIWVVVSAALTWLLFICAKNRVMGIFFSFLLCLGFFY